MVFKRIYKHYNLLIDLCFWVQTYCFVKARLQGLGVLPKPLYPENAFGVALYAIQLALLYPSLVVLPTLLFVTRFRDEYAERLWQKTATTFARAMFFLPLLWVLGWQIAEALHGGFDWVLTLQVPEVFPHPSSSANVGVSPGIRQFLGIDLVLGSFLMGGPMLFAGIYKWHRWRDRGE